MATSPTRGPSSPRGNAAGNLSPRFEGPARGAHGPTWENTYITKPEGYEKARRAAMRRSSRCAALTRTAPAPQFVKFNRGEVAAIIQQKLRNRLEGTEYAADTAAAVRHPNQGCGARRRPVAARRGSCVAASRCRTTCARQRRCVARLRRCAALRSVRARARALTAAAAGASGRVC